MTQPLEKPRRPPGACCPFWRRDVSKVCHTCDMWEPLPVALKVDGQMQQATDMWACTLKHQTFLLRDLIKSVDGVQQATETFRNQAWNESQANLRDMLRLARHIDHRNDALPPAGGEALMIGD